MYNVGGSICDEVLELWGREGLDLLIGGEAVKAAPKKIPHNIVHFFALDALAAEACAKIWIIGLENA